MEQSFWERIQKLKESITGNVEPLEDVRLSTRIVKGALGVFLVQSAVIALWWSVKDGTFYPWLIPISAVLQVGWFWNKVTDSWKIARGQYESLVDLEEPASLYEERAPPPTINIQNTGITGKVTKSVMQLDLQSARASTIRPGPSELLEPAFMTTTSENSE